ncbi:MAG TPA: S8 family peptidase [Vineibacter sp.]|nr:S8 family peptidase [Vineibacter sp.]
MAIEVPNRLVEFILLGPADDRRQLQDSPILGDVWITFAKNPNARLDLLITPAKTERAGDVAVNIQRCVHALKTRADNDDDSITFLQGIVAARLSFTELIRVVVPMTKWWDEKFDRREGRHTFRRYDAEKIEQVLRTILHSAAVRFGTSPSRAIATGRQMAHDELTPFDRYVALTALILWAGEQKDAKRRRVVTPSQRLEDILSQADAAQIAAPLVALIADAKDDKLPNPRVFIWRISLNRTAVPAICDSVLAVKADAAKTLFKVNCERIAWAILDSGIDGSHPALCDAKTREPRVIKSFDFTYFRRIVNLGNSKRAVRAKAAKLLADKAAAGDLMHETKDFDASLKAIVDDVMARRPLDWDPIERLIEVRPQTRPLTGHGTHVAGIMAASKDAANTDATQMGQEVADGMCPDIRLYDFRVIGPSVAETEFAIIAALQFIRHLNDRDNHFSIHGANLSLSIPHDIRNFACGRTPICIECERLVDSGVVVVAAAGNHGYKTFETKDGDFDSYAAFSITDPGNADGVITVGATHRSWPHTYGVSFFSSRGPTGDGRLKPDLVAPGERIHAPLPGDAWGDLDGTSMAAPHVSGAAAMLMARYAELIGQPRRIKRILCESATDLGRERTFQGHGMLDVLRAFQKI